MGPIYSRVFTLIGLCGHETKKLAFLPAHWGGSQRAIYDADGRSFFGAPLTERDTE